MRPVINSAQFLSGFSNIGSRQIGLIFRGDDQTYVDYTSNYRAPLITYAFGVVNGNGPNKDDNNDYKDIAARLVYTLPVDYSSWFRQLQVGVSGYRGYTSLGAASSTAVIDFRRLSRAMLPVRLGAPGAAEPARAGSRRSPATMAGAQGAEGGESVGRS